MRVHLISYWNNNIFCHGPKKFWYPSNLWKSFRRINCDKPNQKKTLFCVWLHNVMHCDASQCDAAVLQIESYWWPKMSKPLIWCHIPWRAQQIGVTSTRRIASKMVPIEFIFLHMGQLYLGQDPFSVMLETIRFKNTWSRSYKSFEVKMI